MKREATKFCAYTGAPLCPRCHGSAYLCDPQKNTACKHRRGCGTECTLTLDPEFAKDRTPICTKNYTHKGGPNGHL